jgi:hypothetical protein
MQGVGVKTWGNGKMYRGSFVEGEQQGEGELFQPNGEQYKGGFHLNIKHGKLNKNNIIMSRKRITYNSQEGCNRSKRIVIYRFSIS